MAIIYLSNENLQREVATRVHIENTLSEANFKKNHVSGKTFASPIIINTLINLSSIFIYLYTHTPEASYNTPKNGRKKKNPFKSLRRKPDLNTYTHTQLKSERA